jgi:hypothetical protein
VILDTHVVHVDPGRDEHVEHRDRCSGHDLNQDTARAR